VDTRPGVGEISTGKGMSSYVIIIALIVIGFAAGGVAPANARPASRITAGASEPKPTEQSTLQTTAQSRSLATPIEDVPSRAEAFEAFKQGPGSESNRALIESKGMEYLISACADGFSELEGKETCFQRAGFECECNQERY